MIPDELYNLAFQFKKTQLWKKLYDSQLFAVSHSDGSIGYCCVMGMMGQHLALAVYPGDEGMRAYRKMGVDRSMMSEFEMQETALSQDCVMVSFESKSDLRPREAKELSQYCAAHGVALRGKNACPQFERFRPHYFPWYVDDEADQTHLKEALEAAIAVSESLTCIMPEEKGFTEGAPFDRMIPMLEKKEGAFVWSLVALPEPKPVQFPSPVVKDDIALAKLAKSKKRRTEWACDVLMHVEPLSTEETAEGYVEEPIDAPFYPYMLLIIDDKSEMVLNVQLSANPDDYTECFVQTILDTAIKNGKPSKILVCNERTHALFAHLAAQIGAELVMKDRIPALEEAEQSLLDHVGGESGDEMAQVMEMLQDPKALRDVPDELLMPLAQMAEMGGLPDELVRNLQSECRRRGIW